MDLTPNDPLQPASNQPEQTQNPQGNVPAPAQAAPAPAVQEATAPVTAPAASPEVVPIAAPVAAPVKTQTPEEKAALRQLMLKRLAGVSAGLYLGVMVLILGWAFTLANSSLGIFDYLPLSQKEWNAMLMSVLNIQLGILTGTAFFAALVGLLKSMLAKKDDLEQKKKASGLALKGGVALFLCVVLWLLALAMVAPRLTPQARAGSPILTLPEETLGLTSPIEIEFDASQIPVDESLYRIVAYTWDFGDGSSGNGEKITHTYAKKAKGNGVYMVVLTVEYMDVKTGQTFEDQFKKEVSIANEKTAAYFTFSPEGGEIPLKVQFDATGSYDPDGEIVSYEWDVNGDGNFDDGEGEILNYTFEQEGEFEVTLRVTDNSGEFSTATHTVEAGTLNGLRAVISTDVNSEARYYTGEAYDFSGELSQVREGKITKYTWDFGDGSKPVQSRNVTHEFTAKGEYVVKLTVQDQNGNTDETQMTIQVIEEGTPPTADIVTTPAAKNNIITGRVPLIVGFSGTTSTDPEDDIVSYEWDFDNDGQIDTTGDSASHVYEEVGEYEARLVTVDSVGNTDEKIVNIVATEQGVVARLEVTAAAGEVPLTVKFDASGSSFKEGHIVSYEYDFGDGSEPYTGGSSVTYRYVQVGTFTAKVTVFGDNGKTDTASVQIVVRPVELTACFTVNTDSGAAPLFVSVDPSCSEGTIATYQWDFGDGDLSFDRKPETHIYANPGSYTITLEVTSAEGIVSEFTNTITVR